MTHSGRRMRVCAAAALTVLAAAFFVTGGSAGIQAAPIERDIPAPRIDEVRAMWVLRTSLTTPEQIATLVRTARDHGFNTLFVQVRGRGDAYFRGGVGPRPAELLRQPEGFDPLASVLKSGHAAGLRVHAWINVN